MIFFCKTLLFKLRFVLFFCLHSPLKMIKQTLQFRPLTMLEQTNNRPNSMGDEKEKKRKKKHCYWMKKYPKATNKKLWQHKNYHIVILSPFYHHSKANHRGWLKKRDVQKLILLQWLSISLIPEKYLVIIARGYHLKMTLKHRPILVCIARNHVRK